MLNYAWASKKPPRKWYVVDPIVADSIDDLTIDGESARIIQDEPEPFQIYDNGPVTIAPIIVLASALAVTLIADADTWFVDGTFTMATREVVQLYVKRAPLGKIAVSTVCAVLQRMSLPATWNSYR